VTGSASGEIRPAPALFDAVVGQSRAVHELLAAGRRPVHAYLLHGPPGSGKRVAARALAAALLCPDGGCGRCNTCRRALAGTHPDLTVVERSGASLDVDEARSVVSRAQRRPLEANRQVLVIADVHLAIRAAPALLKTVEEPPPSTFFILLADSVPPGLATIASRCIKIAFDPVPRQAVVAWLEARGIDPERAESVAQAADGNLDRARLLVNDPEFVTRLAQWQSVPSRLDGTGAAAAVAATELLELAERAVAPLREQHALELSALADRADLTGTKGIPGRKQVEEEHRRRERRFRTDDLRFGLATLAGLYRDRLVAATTASATGLRESGRTPSSAGSATERRRLFRQIEAIDGASAALDRNANEALLMDALMVELSGMAD